MRVLPLPLIRGDKTHGIVARYSVTRYRLGRKPEERTVAVYAYGDARCSFCFADCSHTRAALTAHGDVALGQPSRGQT